MACCDIYVKVIHLVQHDILWPREILYRVLNPNIRKLTWRPHIVTELGLRFKNFNL